MSNEKRLRQAQKQIYSEAHQLECIQVLASLTKPGVSDQIRAEALAELGDVWAYLGRDRSKESRERKKLLGTLLGKGFTSRTAYKAALALDPRNKAAHYGLGQAALARKQLATARGHFEAVLHTREKKHTFTLVYAAIYMGQILTALSKQQRGTERQALIDDAIAHYRLALKIHKPNAERNGVPRAIQQLKRK